ncbi:MAG: PHP domain-containing protein [Cyanobacteria bacterium P01_A01_bin.105]
MLELHCHTTFSDGTLTPQQLVERAMIRGVRALAITDHDTIAGWADARRAAQTSNPSLEIVPGIELSTVHLGRSLHVLGYYPDPDRISAPLQERVEGRKRRARKMAEKLAALGYPIQLPAMPGAMAPGRPHIAKALVAAGHVRSTEEAFQRFLRDDGPAYVPYDKFTVQAGITLLKSCGAVPVWAHPFLFRGATVATVLPDLVAAGLMGIEVYHPHHSPSDRRELEAYCQTYGLLMTGGSDYHGPPTDKRKEHHDLNSLAVPLALLDGVKQAAAGLTATPHPPLHPHS